MPLTNNLEVLVGKKIKGVVAFSGESGPKFKVHLVLDNGHYFEFYGNELENAKHLRPGGLKEACEPMGYNIVKIYTDELRP